MSHADRGRMTGKQEGTKLLLVCGQFTRSAAWLPEIHSILEKNLTAGKAKPMQCSLLVAKHGKAALRRVLRSFVLNDVQISARSQQILGHFQPAEGFDLPLWRAPPDRIGAPENVLDSERVNDHSHHVRGEDWARGHHVSERAAHFHVDVVDLRIFLFPRTKV